MWFKNLHLFILAVWLVVLFASSRPTDGEPYEDALLTLQYSIATWPLRATTCPGRLVSCINEISTIFTEEKHEGSTQSYCCPPKSSCIASENTGRFICCPDGINCLHGAIVEGTEDGCADTSWTPAFGTGDKGEGEGQPFCCLPGQHGLRSDEGNYCVDISSTSVLTKREGAENSSKPKSAKQKKAEKIYVPILYIVTCGWLPLSLIFVTVSLVRSYYKQKIAAFNRGTWRTQFREVDRERVVDAGLNGWGRKVKDLPMMENAVVREPRRQWSERYWRR
ncbi:uncharacterized protein LAJ45_08907 [Morchella importuna]|uniref:uncharacterized protein n=1 Tax=Morchella importuna TaxID=1174673 RepID=UPI001E8EE2C8|nr:uncharacterized protein LAJ45_08907 [Morchella importuna]KAH8147107.1 hypothetical protein LAJ45_08907 [Morchella importuna]